MTDTRSGTTAPPRRVTGDLVTVEDRGDVRVLTLNQPKALNALNADLERRHPTCKGE
ncbi:hypothetical protein AAFP32_02205 [Brevibacterium sp. CBA3109]|uniref:Enoyl-CoA hydratase/isomerase family protein n=1 Tax=Brevibacterium koreense TaxID=3140787 RepID=A0AAU7UMA9_9MICO